MYKHGLDTLLQLKHLIMTIFFKKLIEYPDKAISKAATHTFCGHIWYIVPESIALSFFIFSGVNRN